MMLIRSRTILSRGLRTLLLAIAMTLGLASPGWSQSAGTPGAAPLAGPALANFLVGRWTDTNDCNVAIDFQPGGRFTLTQGGSGRWSVADAMLTFESASRITARVRVVNQGSIELHHSDGTVGHSTRCGGTAATPAPAPAPGLALAGPALARFLVGRWTDNGDCNNVIDFRPDGTFMTPQGSGRWSVNDTTLSFIGQRTVTARVRVPNQNRVELHHPDGSLGHSTRC